MCILLAVKSFDLVTLKCRFKRVHCSFLAGLLFTIITREVYAEHITSLRDPIVILFIELLLKLVNSKVSKMDPLKKKYKQALKISEIANYLQDLEDCSEEDLNDIEVAILPPDEVDEVTDIEEGPDDDMESAKECLSNMITDLDGKSAVKIFKTILCDEVLEYIVHETVTYAKHYKNDLNFKLTINELKVFIEILFFSSYHHLPQSKLYWCRDEDVHIPFVERAMSRKRFDKIKSYLHFNDNSRIDNTDKAFKIRPFIDKANESFRKFGIFESKLAVDEMIVKYFGHHGIKQFIKGKPVRFGYKLWALCGVSGYCYNFSLYIGKETQIFAGTADGLGSRVVKKLLAVCMDPSAHEVYFDNFFSSVQLLIDLKSQGFRATGTVRDNRTKKCPIMTKQEMKKKHRGYSDHRFDKNNEILCVKWHDNNVVCLLTNFDTVEPFVKTNRYSKTENAKVSVNQPRLIHNYNKNIGGVDKHDWLISKYPIRFRGKKWYWPLVIRVLDMSLVNTWIIYNRVNKDETIPLLDFRRRVCFSWMKKSEGSTCKPTPGSSKVLLESVRFDNIGHYVTKRGKQRRRQGQGCKKNLSFCAKCDKTLCSDCFIPYHTK
ncbi:PiggyBac transposable element-derived protein 3 [Eumeta japonica]|uniref:PiggyBac transposable element-derived protein 3 n=1 Tax=Eumeta variegata TaxID=151549 RepID=A0A4C1Y8H9_EUMVA|nr:PiggyBac transposable element-derived protein 3 [Eumeta japonica]